MREKIRKLHELLEKYVHGFVHEGGGGIYPSLPKFELHPDDYLGFAEDNLRNYSASELESKKISDLISCISNLKRALDCQIESFLHAYGIKNKLKGKNLSSKQKLDFINRIGIFSSRTIERFSLLRNKIEHEFLKPHVADIEALFDLVTAYVSLLKNAIHHCYDINSEFNIYNDEEFLIGYLTATYIKESLSIEFNFRLYKNAIDEEKAENVKDPNIRKMMYETRERFKLEASIDELDTFIYYFRCLFVLASLFTFATSEHIRHKLKVEQSD